MYTKAKSKSASNALEQLRLIDKSPSRSMTPLFKIYSSLFQAEQDFLKVKKTLKYLDVSNSIPLATIKACANQLETIIGTLGHITLVTDPRIDKAAIILEIINKLDLKKQEQIEYIGNRIQKLTSLIISTCKDKHFQSCLDQQKEKAWRLIEALDEYAKTQYKYSIFN